ncbi:MAG TPA: FGGY family carbohydrate kinase [Candidatus Limnocylindrales bacterium]|nr:FGGY family carbohydrate kinase [Candidatus Limnocylindrales bacterium]
MDRLLLGIDLGSSAAKATLVDERGGIISRATVPQSVSRPVPGAAEQDPDEWWSALPALVAATLGTLPPSEHGRLAGLAISGHYPTLLLADGGGEPLAPAMLYGDRRADSEVDAAAALGGEALVGDEWLPKLLWLRRMEPGLLRRTRMVFNPHDHVAFRLTGERGLDHRSARRSGGLFDPRRLAWRSDVCAATSLPPAALPPLRRAGEELGRVTAAAAATSGVPAGTRVVVGLGDTPAELIGAGVAHPGDALLYYGTTTSVDVCTHDVEAYLRDPAPIADWAPYNEVAYAVLGPALPWVAAGLEPSGSVDSGADISRLDALAAALEPSLDAPYVVPSFLAHARPGAPIRRPAILGLDVGHSRVDLHRALLESFGFIARAGLEAADIDPGGLRCIATGGGARSAAWRQLVSDVLGAVQVWRPSADAALGSAALAAWATCGADVFSPGNWTTETGAPSTEPDADRHRVEDARYRTWRRFRDALPS